MRPETCGGIFCSSWTRQFFREAHGVKKRNSAEHAEGAIDHAPAKGNSTDRTADERQRNDENTSNQSRVDNPDVPNRINQGTDEKNGDDQVAEREPIRSVRDPRIVAVHIVESISHGPNPMTEAVPGRANQLCEPVDFQSQWKGCDAT